jgi:plasmid stabilization system protein ParE
VLPERYRVIIPPKASNDLVEICAYIEQDSPQNAASVAQMILDAIDSLDILPHRFKVHEHRRDPAKTVRSMPVPPFIVYYRVDDVRHAVRILHVRHGHRRQPRRFR